MNPNKHQRREIMIIFLLIFLRLHLAYSLPKIYHHRRPHPDDTSASKVDNKFEDESRLQGESQHHSRHSSLRHHRDTVNEPSRHQRNNIHEPISSRHHFKDKNNPVSYHQNFSQRKSGRAVDKANHKHKHFPKSRELSGQGNLGQRKKDSSKSKLVIRGLESDDAGLKVRKKYALGSPTSELKSSKTQFLEDLERDDYIFWLKMTLMGIASLSFSAILILVIGGCCCSQRPTKSYAYPIQTTPNFKASTSTLDPCVKDRPNKAAIAISKAYYGHNKCDEESSNKSMKLRQQNCTNCRVGNKKKSNFQSKSSKNKKDSLKFDSSSSSESNSPINRNLSRQSNSPLRVHPKEMAPKVNFEGYSECTFDSHTIARASKKYRDFVSLQKNANLNMKTRKISEDFKGRPYQGTSLMI